MSARDVLVVAEVAVVAWLVLMIVKRWPRRTTGPMCQAHTCSRCRGAHDERD